MHSVSPLTGKCEANELRTVSQDNFFFVIKEAQLKKNQI